MHLSIILGDQLGRKPTSEIDRRPSPIIKLLIAAENRIDVQLLRNSLDSARSGVQVAGGVFSIHQTQAFLSSDLIDVALVGENLEDGNLQGFKLTSEIRRLSPKTRTIMLLKKDVPELVVDAFRAGAKGVFCYDASLNALPKCIRAVHSGQIWANKNQLVHVLDSFAQAAGFNPSAAVGHRPLTKREEDVAKLVAEGLTNREVAKQLGLTEHTVSNYLLRVYEKLGMSSRVELVLYQLKKQRS